MASDSLEQGKDFDQVAFEKYISEWEWQWVNKRKDYPANPMGNSIDQSMKLYKIYKNEIKADY
jgi:alpha-N-acetylglucosaminidase